MSSILWTRTHLCHHRTSVQGSSARLGPELGAIKFLDEMSDEDLVKHGGKTTGLVRLIRLGVPVPPGFSIPYDHFDRFINSTPDIRRNIRDIASTEDVDRILSSALQIEKQITDYTIPADFRSKIEQSLVRLNALRSIETGYAVRSSASIEDNTRMSFAGQAKSFLAVKTLDGVLNAVKGVWQSVLTVGAILYLKSMGMTLSDIRVGVLVQEMVDADVSGVMFTADTASSDMNRVVIQSTWGLCEPLVSGRVVPDTYTVEKTTRRIVDMKIGSKQVECHPNREGEGTMTEMTDPERRQQSTLSDAQVMRIANLGCHIEKLLGGPQDIEWCMHRGQLSIVQCRPVTTIRGDRPVSQLSH